MDLVRTGTARMTRTWIWKGPIYDGYLVLIVEQDGMPIFGIRFDDNLGRMDDVESNLTSAKTNPNTRWEEVT